MKYYVIYHKGVFVGYSNSHEMVKNFIECRKPYKYMVRIFKEKDISEDILQNDMLSNFELSYYQGYNLINELPVFEYEREMIDNILYEDICDMCYTCHSLLDKLPYIKFDSELDYLEVTALIERITTELWSTLEDMTYDDVIDLVKYFKHKLLKDINESREEIL